MNKNKATLPGKMHGVVWLLAMYSLALLAFSCQPSSPGHSINLSDKPYLRVGVYNGNGASPVCVLETLEALKIDQGIVGEPIGPVDIETGKLQDLDVLIFPGGSGSQEFNSLGQSASGKVKAFAAQKDKGLVGICAGGYLMASTPGYPSLKLLPARTIRYHYDRGRALIAFQTTGKGKEIFPELKNQATNYIQYYDGPIYEIDKENPPQVLGTVVSDIATHSDDPKGVTPGKPAFMTIPYGEGRIFISIGHPEATPGMRWIVPRMARWVGHKPLISYSKLVVRPGINQHEILYFPELISFEKENFWNLFSENDSLVLAAIKNLDSIRSRPSIRWAKGLLRHNSPAVRLSAAKYLLRTEYTDAIPELEIAVANEPDPKKAKELSSVLNKLKSILHNPKIQ